LIQLQHYGKNGRGGILPPPLAAAMSFISGVFATSARAAGCRPYRLERCLSAGGGLRSITGLRCARWKRRIFEEKWANGRPFSFKNML
jgi:hypothetical protein